MLDGEQLQVHRLHMVVITFTEPMAKVHADGAFTRMLILGRRNGHFTGFPQLGVRWQRMESDALKTSHGMAPGQKGVLVRSVAPLANAARVLKPGDVIMKFDGIQVASDGTVPFRHVPVIHFASCLTLL